MKNISYIAILLILSVIMSCSGSDGEKTKEKPSGDEIIKINKYLVNEDADKIRAYVKRRNWDMQVTQSGLWYMIYKKGSGLKAEIGKKATINYVISLLDGTVCYSSDKDGQKSFVIGKGSVESGLEEGILFMHEGDKARFILPPHLAHGLIGDENRIPARATIIYDVELVKISD